MCDINCCFCTYITSQSTLDWISDLIDDMYRRMRQQFFSGKLSTLKVAVALKTFDLVVTVKLNIHIGHNLKKCVK